MKSILLMMCMLAAASALDPPDHLLVLHSEDSDNLFYVLDYMWPTTEVTSFLCEQPEDIDPFNDYLTAHASELDMVIVEVYGSAMFQSEESQYVPLKNYYEGGGLLFYANDRADFSPNLNEVMGIDYIVDVVVGNFYSMADPYHQIVYLVQSQLGMDGEWPGNFSDWDPPYYEVVVYADGGHCIAIAEDERSIFALHYPSLVHDQPATPWVESYQLWENVLGFIWGYETSLVPATWGAVKTTFSDIR